MINLEKIKFEINVSSPPTPPPLHHTHTHTHTHTLLREPAPAPYFHLLFLIFQIPTLGGGNQNLLSPTLKRGRGRLVRTMLYTIFTIFIRKTNLKLDLLNLNIFGSNEYEKMAIFYKQLNFVLLTKKRFKTIHI